ncbi:cellulase family glycosylhydrolase [Pyxidicoccus sp. 3LFB2]
MKSPRWSAPALALLGFAGLVGTAAAQDTLSAGLPLHQTAYYGSNISGAEFGDVSGPYGNQYIYPGAETMDPLVAKGFKYVRLPFKWERIQRALNSPLDSDEVARLKGTVALAHSKGLSVLVDMHNFGGYRGNQIGSAAVTPAHFADVWSRIALALRDQPGVVGYDIMNEPHDMPAADAWFRGAQAAINAIRQVDTVTPIYINGDCWASAANWVTCSDNLKNLVDPSNKLVYQAHQYFDRDASGRYVGSYDAEGAHPDIGVNRIRPYVQWLRNNNKIGMLGEYGVPDDDPRWLVALDRMLAFASANCVSGTYWSAGPWWGDYKLAIQPRNGQDRPQMAVLANYTVEECGTPPPPTEAYTKHAASASPSTVVRGQEGQSVRLSVSIQAAGAASNRNVKLEVRNASRQTLAGVPFTHQGFAQGEVKTYELTYAVPTTLPNGTYCLTAGVADSTWTTWRYWDDCTTSFTVAEPVVAFTLASATASPTTVDRGSTVRLSAAFQAQAAASGMNVKLEVRDAAGVNKVGERASTNQAFGAAETKTWLFDYAVPSTLAPGTYCLAAGVANSAWNHWYVWNGCATRFTVR